MLELRFSLNLRSEHDPYLQKKNYKKKQGITKELLLSAIIKYNKMFVLLIYIQLHFRVWSLK